MVSTSPDPSDSPPAYALTDQPGNFEVSLVAQPSTQELLVSLVPPAKPQLNEKKTDRRAPVDLCLVIDVSGSMNTEAPVPGEQDKNETTGLSVLDVVKHATRTIIESMGDDDRIAVVTFSDSAEIIAPLTFMNNNNREAVWSLVEGLRTTGMTNLWDGLKTGMNVLTGNIPAGKRASPKSSTRPVSPPHPPPVPAMFATQRGPLRHAIGLVDRPQPFPLPTQELRAPPEPNIKTPNLEIQDSTSTQLDSDEQRLSAVFILTDGQPNVEPPRGHIPMIKSYLDALSPDAPKFTISTFGFGYNLDSRLLDEIAHLGQGMYGFIPDSGMVGTVFVHALANLMVTWATGCVLDIEVVTKDPKAETQVVVMGALPVTYSSWGASIKVGDIQYGQSKDFVIKLPSACFGSGPRQGVTITAKHLPHTHSDKVSLNLIAALEPNHEVESSIVLQHHVFRLSFIDAVSKILEESKRPNVTDLLQRQFEQSIASYLNDPVLKNYEPSKALAMDITSQVILGLEPKNWARWGVHYIPSIARSHQRQQCLNFKDEGLQVYGRDSDIFISTRDHIDQIFDSLPPPTPSLRGQAVYRPGSQIPAMYTPVGSMASYRSKKLPCFAGWCYIDTESGKIRLSELGRGTIVRTPSGTARVAAVLRTLCSGQMTELCTIGQLAITPWHPIYHNGSWVFPTQIQQAKLLACNYVYSVLLEPSSDSESHAVFIEGIRCVTLGHGCIDSLRAHPFLGDYARVVESLSQLDGYYDKSGVVDCAGVVRQYRKVLTAIRVHKRQTDQNRLLDTDPISAAVTRALGYSTSVILAVSLPPPDLENLVSVLPRDTVLVDGEVTNTAKVYILPFTKATYGRFIPALNAIVAFAHDKRFEGVLFQSVEVKIDPENVKKMVGLCVGDVLVVGKAFDAHTFHKGLDDGSSQVYLTGRTCPWNTLAVWNLNKLARTGFLLTSETNTPPNSSAIEEAPTIALHQKLFPGQSRALLVRFAAEDGWGTVWADPARVEWHARKMASKDTSAAAHISNVGLSGSITIVEHVQIN
ncbi:unnamed protein product [Rhizoctonia solani]|uniref:VWFA domain-containing protein n=1 Tax=Rhizoctonia solani TaxID=456999 RepID=A0A8H2WAX1_9AGAM|nr:unnamed protein product [Rhizoctonia solani]